VRFSRYVGPSTNYKKTKQKSLFLNFATGIVNLQYDTMFPSTITGQFWQQYKKKSQNKIMMTLNENNKHHD